MSLIRQLSTEIAKTETHSEHATDNFNWVLAYLRLFSFFLDGKWLIHCFYLLHCISDSAVCQLSINRWLIQFHHPFSIFSLEGVDSVYLVFLSFLSCMETFFISLPHAFFSFSPRTFPFPPTNR